MNHPLVAFVPCPSGCEVPPQLHRHYAREPGVYFKLAAPTACCGREWMRADELLMLDQCAWCWADHGTLVPGVCAGLVYPLCTVRNAPTRRQLPQRHRRAP